jgi:hypothetical protein
MTSDRRFDPRPARTPKINLLANQHSEEPYAALGNRNRSPPPLNRDHFVVKSVEKIRFPGGQGQPQLFNDQKSLRFRVEIVEETVTPGF